MKTNTNKIMNNRPIKFRAWNVETNQFELPLYRGVANLNINDILRGSTLLYQQFTGLLDKNGKEIYEGDILLIEDTQKVQITDDGQGPTEDSNHLSDVAFKQGCFGVNIKETADCYGQGFWSFYQMENDMGDTPDKLEVIGNIWENPELLNT